MTLLTETPGRPKTFQHEVGEVLVYRKDILSMEASAKGRQVCSQKEANPVGQVAGWAPASSKAVTGLLRKEGLSPQGDEGEVEVALQEGGVQLLVGRCSR